jgi:hypothetical protein
MTVDNHISCLVETLIEEVLPLAKLELRRYNGNNEKIFMTGMGEPCEEYIWQQHCSS